MKMVDRVYNELKNESWFKEMSMDEQGEFCMKMSESLVNVGIVAMKAAVSDFFRQKDA